MSKTFSSGKWIWLLTWTSLLTLAACVQLEESGKSAFLLITREQEASLGAESFNQLKQGGKVSGDPMANTQLQRVAQYLIRQVNVPNANWEIVVFDDPSPNAFALPGGKIGVHTGILALTRNDAGLAAVLGHELAHVTLRHGGQRISQQMAISISAATIDTGLAMKDVQQRGAIMSALGVSANFGAILPFSRSNEYEADRYRMLYMAKAGYDPQEALAFWQRMKAASDASGGKPPEWLSTHPADENRIKQLQELLPQA